MANRKAKPSSSNDSAFKKLSLIKRTRVWVVAGLAIAAVGTVASLITSARTILEGTEAIVVQLFPSFDPLKASAPREEYVRLFGQGGVPPLMALQESGGRFTDASDVVFRPQLDRDVFPLSRESVTFWRSEWPFREAKALINTDLWLKYSGNHRYYFLINSVLGFYNKSLVACVFKRHQDEELDAPTGEAPIGKNIAAENCNDPPEVSIGEVGFTFVIIKNTIDKPIRNIEVAYRLGVPSASIWEMLKAAGIHTEADFYEFLGQPQRLTEFFHQPNTYLSSAEYYSDNLEPAAATELRASRGQVVSRSIESMNAGESCIFLLNVYLPDKSNLPAYYLDDILLLDTLSFEIDGRRITRPFRKPLGEKAARKSLSWGWYAQ